MYSLFKERDETRLLISENSTENLETATIKSIQPAPTDIKRAISARYSLTTIIKRQEIMLKATKLKIVIFLIN